MVNRAVTHSFDYFGCQIDQWGSLDSFQVKKLYRLNIRNRKQLSSCLKSNFNCFGDSGSVDICVISQPKLEPTVEYLVSIFDITTMLFAVTLILGE